MPKLVKFLVFHAGIGFAIALTSVLAIFFYDISHLRTLIMSSDVKWLAAAVLIILMTITLGSVTMGIAVMRLPYCKGDGSSGRGLRQHALTDRVLGLWLIRGEPALARARRPNH